MRNGHSDSRPARRCRAVRRRSRKSLSPGRDITPLAQGFEPWVVRIPTIPPSPGGATESSRSVYRIHPGRRTRSRASSESENHELRLEGGRPAPVVSPSDLGSIVPPGLGGLTPHRNPGVNSWAKAPGASRPGATPGGEDPTLHHRPGQGRDRPATRSSNHANSPVDRPGS